MYLTIQLLGKKHSPAYIKLGQVFASLLFLWVTYLWFKEDIYIWLCKNENSSAACTVVGMLNENQKYYESADDNYEKACNQNYALACFKRGVLAKERKQEDSSKKYFEKACSLGHESACLKP